MSATVKVLVQTESTAKLYSPQLLGLATQLAAFPLSGDLPLLYEARSRSCGSVISIGILLGYGGAIDQIGLKVSACAIGQASAAIMAGDIKGRTIADTQRILTEIEAWLNVGDDAPNWPGFEALLPAMPHQGRHGAILLPWQAAIGALSMIDAAS